MKFSLISLFFNNGGKHPLEDVAASYYSVFPDPQCRYADSFWDVPRELRHIGDVSLEELEKKNPGWLAGRGH